MPACVRRLFKFSDTNFIANLYRSNKVIWHSLQDFTFRSFITSSDPTSPKSKGDVGCVFECCALLYYDYNLHSNISIHFCMCCRFLYLYLRYNHIQDVDSGLFQQIIYIFLIVQIFLYLCNERAAILNFSRSIASAQVSM